MQFTYLIAWWCHNCDTSQSQQFNFSLHVKINHFEFEDKFSIKTHKNVKIFLPEDC